MTSITKEKSRGKTAEEKRTDRRTLISEKKIMIRMEGGGESWRGSGGDGTTVVNLNFTDLAVMWLLRQNILPNLQPPPHTLSPHLK